LADEAIALIEKSITRFLDEVPALKPMKLVVALDLQGRGDTQQFRVELPGPKVTRQVAADAKVRMGMRREFFNEMAKDAKVADWREAFMYGQAKASGPTQILQLIERVVAKHEERQRLSKARSRGS
jgi:hypothetical protein